MNPFPTPQEAVNKYGPVIGIKEVMKILGVGRPIATQICLDSECPKVPRKKYGQFTVYTARFIKWITDEEDA